MINEDVYKAILERKMKQRKPGRYIHPSSLECGRRMTFEVMGFPARAKIDAKLLAIMKLGKLIHQMVQDELKEGLPIEKPGSKFTPEVPINKGTYPRAEEYLVRGFADGIGDEPDSRWTLEIKTVGIGELTTLTRPRPAHNEQLNTYLFLLDIKQGVFLYVARENLDARKWFPIGFDETMWGMTSEKIKGAIDGAMTKRLMPVPLVDSYTCRICPYAYACRDKDAWVDADSL